MATKRNSLKIQLPESEAFNFSFDVNGIVIIGPGEATKQTQLSPLVILEKFAVLVAELIRLKDIAGIIYQCPLADTEDDYKRMFDEAGNYARINALLTQSISINSADKPVVAIIDRPLSSIQLAPMLWSHYIIAQENIQLSLPDTALGIFPGLGATAYTTQRLSVSDAASMLIKGATINATKALDSGLIQQIAVDAENAVSMGVNWVLAGASHNKGSNSAREEQENITSQLAAFKKKINPRFPGIQPCFELIEAGKKRSLAEALQLEAKKYAEVLQSPFARAIMRTMHYGVKEAQNTKQISGTVNFRKIGIIGAGMMGSGIAYEVAKSGIDACLKDTTIELAEKGKQYSEKCCDKLIALGKMAESEKSTLLSLIQPSDKATDLKNSDMIIEAVFEQETLKGSVIKESEPFLKSGGIFSTNTTSLPISRLAKHSTQPQKFIGMHFFSPVDRMPLVEIIVGRQTDKATVNGAITLALKLRKTPIVVHDSPAFFTSRIFFNYLLEAITMLLEGIPAAEIETAALHAGFAVSPLAVLDEISLPLMAHVYDQLPQLSSSQKRCYNYLKALIAQHREGRKAGKGFYDYDVATGKKQLWQDWSIRLSSQTTDPAIIQKRLLHVMALDSYRCLDEGVLDQPIDGDIGSILGVGYAAHTGGAIAHMDQVGLAEFVKDCDSFSGYGEQWYIPDSLRTLAKQGYVFYEGFTSNWPQIK